MIKKYFYLMAVILLSVGFVSCDKDDDDLGITEAQVIANWMITEFKTSESGTYTPWLFEDTGAVFMKSGDYFGYGYFGYGTGTWKLSGKKITCYVDGQVYAYYEVINLSSNTCELKMGAPKEDSNIWIKCKKIGE